MNNDRLLWDILHEHLGHHVVIAAYGDCDDPADIYLECEDCNEVLLDAELYTICTREDGYCRRGSDRCGQTKERILSLPSFSCRSDKPGTGQKAMESITAAQNESDGRGLQS